MTVTPEDWSQAFARQALADFNAWEVLDAETTLPRCQKLHFLQMTCEKLCKAYLCQLPNANPEDYQHEHTYTAKNLDLVIRWLLIARAQDPYKARQLLARCKFLAGEIEKLAPTADKERRPDNCEYPWVQDGKLIVPAEYPFVLVQRDLEESPRCVSE